MSVIVHDVKSVAGALDFSNIFDANEDSDICCPDCGIGIEKKGGWVISIKERRKDSFQLNMLKTNPEHCISLPLNKSYKLHGYVSVFFTTGIGSHRFDSVCV